MLDRTLFHWGALWAGTLMLSACSLLQPAAPTAPAVVAPAVPASAPVVVAPPALPPPLPDPADAASRRFLAYHEQVRQMAPADLGNEITRLSGVVSSTATAAPADPVLELSLALAQQHNGGDLTRALALLEPLAKSTAPELAPWQPLARLLLGRVAEQRRLEDQLTREVAQRREQQRNLQQLSEKLEALKAIERSMTTRQSSSAASTPSQAPATTPASAPLAPKAP